jgi:hypothetical protein
MTNFEESRLSAEGEDAPQVKDITEIIDEVISRKGDDR